MSKKIEPYKDIAVIYDQVRPSYPTQLIQDIIRSTKIGLDSKLLRSFIKVYGSRRAR